MARRQQSPALRGRTRSPPWHWARGRAGYAKIITWQRRRRATGCDGAERRRACVHSARARCTAAAELQSAEDSARRVRPRLARAAAGRTYAGARPHAPQKMRQLGHVRVSATNRTGAQARDDRARASLRAATRGQLPPAEEPSVLCDGGEWCGGGVRRAALPVTTPLLSLSPVFQAAATCGLCFPLRRCSSRARGAARHQRIGAATCINGCCTQVSRVTTRRAAACRPYPSWRRCCRRRCRACR